MANCARAFSLIVLILCITSGVCSDSNTTERVVRAVRVRALNGGAQARVSRLARLPQPDVARGPEWFYKLLPGQAGVRAEGAGGAGRAVGALGAGPVALVVPLSALHGAALGPPPLNAPRAPRPPPARSAQQTPSPPLQYTLQVPSSELVELFQAQKAPHPELPPVRVRRRRGVSAEAPPPPPVCLVVGPQSTSPSGPSEGLLQFGLADAAGIRPDSPALPRFQRSLALRGHLTIPRAGFTETYNAMWDAATGSMRVDFFGGATTVYRTVNADKIVRIERRLDRSGDAPLQRCAIMSQDGASASVLDRAPPAIPDLQPFQFVEYGNFEGEPVERWEHTVSGAPGELGGARGEALTFRHEIMFARDPDGFAWPRRYKVAVDSSVLGPECDGYFHRFEWVRQEEPAPEQLRAELGACDVVESAADPALVDPLREFVMPTRDPRHDDLLASYVTKFKRQYQDETEEAVRKNLLTQSSRFSASGNRVGATFRMGATALSDLLDKELRLLNGVAEEQQRLPSEPFAYTRAETRDMHDALPARFNWRDEGGVTHVRFQGLCSSCWAFAVTAAVEGALFRVTRRLVSLSEQAIVDCAHPFGGGGCNATWPTHAFDYVRERGLPGLDAYHDYVAKVLECQDNRGQPVTYISGHMNVTKNSLAALKVAIASMSPAVITMNVAQMSFKNYHAGVYYDGLCDLKSPRELHAMTAVGYDGTGDDGEHLILKNSHGTSWGEAGYIRVAARGKVCGVLDRPSVPLLERPDVNDAADSNRL